MPTLARTLLFVLLLSSSCNNPGSVSNNSDSTQKANATIAAEPKELEAPDDCVFDTSTFKFTTEKLMAYQKDLVYVWDSVQRVAIVRMEDNDTLQLHIGGCDHFNYSAVYYTDAGKFSDTAYLLQKAHWLAKNFLENRFDEKYATAIAKREYTIDSCADALCRSLTIINRDTGITDHIYEPIIFKVQNNRTVIDVGGYVN